MPSGIPPSISGVAGSIQEQIMSVVEYLQIPSYNETSHQLKIAFQDSFQASQSIYQLLKLTCRPLIIFLALLSRYLFIVLRVLSEHTIYHLILATKESWRQLKIGARWFVAFQRGLSRTAIWMEIGFVFLCIGLYMIRRYLQKKKYFKRLGRWYRSKKRNVQMKYNNFVDKVAQTSLVLALLLPHILYIIITLMLKYSAPSFIRYLAMNTISSDVISFYIPFVRTIMVVHKYKNLCTLAQKEKMDSLAAVASGAARDVDTKQLKEGEKSGRLFSFFRSSSSGSRKSTGSSISDEYKKAAQKSSSNTTTGTSSKIKNKKTLSKNESNTNTNTNKATPTWDEEEMDLVSQQAAELLKYWTVYAILTALVQTATLLPILGRIFYNTNPTNAKKAAASISRWSRASQHISWLDKIKLSRQFLEECKLFFFAWLRLLPTAFTSRSLNDKDSSQAKTKNTKNTKNTNTGTGGVMSRIRTLEKQSKLSISTQKSTSIRRKQLKSKDIPFSNQPLDIIYERLAPMAISLVSSSTNIVTKNGINTSNAAGNISGNAEATAFQSFKTKCITFSRTFLDAMVWTKIISESTKNTIVNTFYQCTSLLPAAITLMMPSYFTNYGVIYVRLVVPCANSSRAYDDYKLMKKELGDGATICNHDGIIDDRWMTVSFAMLRLMQYWIIQAILSWILLSFAPVLAWVPLSTHIVWLIWAYVQLEANTKKLYDTLEWDLVAFGILKSSLFPRGSGDTGKETDVNETTTMQLFNSIIKKMPSKLEVGNATDATQSKIDLDHDKESTLKTRMTSEQGRNSEKESKNISIESNASTVKEKMSQQKSNINKPLKQTEDEVEKVEQITEIRHDSKEANASDESHPVKEAGIDKTDVVIDDKKQINDIGTSDVNDLTASEDNDYVCVLSETEKKNQ